MSGMFNFIGTSVIAVSLFAVTSVVDAATGRSAYSNIRSTTIGQAEGETAAVTTRRMPTMPTLPLNTLGNVMHNIGQIGRAHV